jgi:Mg/Co/Ni transporter MgtE
MSLMPTERDRLRSAERQAEALEEMLGVAAKEMRIKDERINELETLINTPKIDDFLEAVKLEAAHQVERWGSAHDAGKEPQDWFWLIGYLAGKALASAVRGEAEKALHHTISTAGACLNWHRALSGESTRMRPGIEPPKEERSASVTGG